MDLDTFLKTLKGVRKAGDGWMALCPAHPDHNPSLSITERRQKILLHCFAGCSYDAVCEAAGITRSELGVNAAYNYVNENGALLFQVVRFEPKGFAQRQPDGNSGWIWNLQGVRRVLYRLPEVIAAESILICEGEKDCDNAARLGVVATCNSGGAGKWRNDYCESLRGKHVVIIMDADEPGRKHAHEIATTLFGKVASIKMVDMPGAKDLSEWLERGHTLPELEQLIADASPWGSVESSLTTAPLPRIQTWDDIPDVMTLPCVEIAWAVEELIPLGAITLFAGEFASYKSWLVQKLAIEIAKGGMFLGRSCKEMDVLYLDAENPQSVVQERLGILGAEPDRRLRVWGGWLSESPPMLGDERLRAIARERKPLIIFDSFIRFHSSDENSATDMAVAMASLRDLANLGATVIVLHHKPKTDHSQYRGSSDIPSGCDVAYSLSRNRDTELLTLACFKTRYTLEFSTTIRPDLDQTGDFIVTEAPALTQDAANVKWLIELIETEPFLTQAQLIEKSKGRIPQRRVQALLRRGEGKDWQVEFGQHNARRYFPISVLPMKEAA